MNFEKIPLKSNDMLLDLVKYLHEKKYDIKDINKYGLEYITNQFDSELFIIENPTLESITERSNTSCMPSRGHYGAFKFLSENNYDMSQWNNYAIEDAVENGAHTAIKYLLENGASKEAAIEMLNECEYAQVYNFIHNFKK